MAHLSGSVVTLRIGGDNLDPEAISSILGCEPTRKQMKGEVSISISGNKRIAKTGMWSLEADDVKPENIDGQIIEIFSKISSDIKAWNSITSQYKVDLFCGLFMNESNEGLTISPESLTILGARGIELGLDIYGPITEKE